MKKRSLRFLSAALCASVAACGGATFSQVEGDAGGGGGSGSSTGSSGAGSSSGSGNSSSSGGVSSSSSSGVSSSGSSGVSSSSSSGGGPGTFDCGPTVTCDGRAQYCNIREGGVPLDGGTNKAYSCTLFPVKCAGNHTCSCVVSTAEPCTEPNGDVTVTELVP